MIFLKLWKIADNLPRPRDTAFRTLSAAKMPHFRHHFSPPPHHTHPPHIPIPREPDSARTSANSYSRLDTEKRAIFGDRWVTRDVPKIMENRGRSTAV